MSIPDDIRAIEFANRGNNKGGFPVERLESFTRVSYKLASAIADGCINEEGDVTIGEGHSDTGTVQSSGTGNWKMSAIGVIGYPGLAIGAANDYHVVLFKDLSDVDFTKKVSFHPFIAHTNNAADTITLTGSYLGVTTPFNNKAIHTAYTDDIEYLIHTSSAVATTTLTKIDDNNGQISQTLALDANTFREDTRYIFFKTLVAALSQGAVGYDLLGVEMRYFRR